MEQHNFQKTFRNYLSRFRIIKFESLNVYRKGSQSNSELLQELATGTKGQKLSSFFKLIKNFSTIKEEKFLSDLQLKIGDLDYVFSGFHYKKGSEHYVYLLHCPTKKGKDLVIKFQIDTMLGQATLNDLELLASERTFLLDIVKEIFNGNEEIEVAEKIYFAAKNPENGKMSLAHLMDFVSFDEGTNVLDIFDTKQEDQVVKLIKDDPRFATILTTFLAKVKYAFLNGIYLDLAGKGNTLLGYVDGKPHLVLVDVETHTGDKKMRVLYEHYLRLSNLL